MKLTRFHITITYTDGLGATVTNYKGTRKEALEYGINSGNYSRQEVMAVVVVEAKDYEE